MHRHSRVGDIYWLRTSYKFAYGVLGRSGVPRESVRDTTTQDRKDKDTAEAAPIVAVPPNMDLEFYIEVTGHYQSAFDAARAVSLRKIGEIAVTDGDVCIRNMSWRLQLFIWATGYHYFILMSSKSVQIRLSFLFWLIWDVFTVLSSSPSLPLSLLHRIWRCDALWCVAMWCYRLCCIITCCTKLFSSLVICSSAISAFENVATSWHYIVWYAMIFHDIVPPSISVTVHPNNTILCILHQILVVSRSILSPSLLNSRPIRSFRIYIIPSLHFDFVSFNLHYMYSPSLFSLIIFIVTLLSLLGGSV